MEVKSLIILVSSSILFPLNIWGQFYTIEKGNALSKRNDPDIAIDKANSEEDFFYMAQDSIERNSVRNKDKDENADFFSSTNGHEVSIEKDIPVFVNMRDSLLFGLIRNRMDVCLPLDYISVNSRFGYRKDPFSKCEKFHDGIDLQCNMQHVYSILPGKVIKVKYSNKGYGNHVVVDYGHIQCLYGHLSMITVTEGAPVLAGTIIGISGRSGRATGPHLHLRISSGRKVLDPEPFISYLNRYITKLQDRIAYLRFGTRPPKELNISNLYEALDKYGIMYPKIVVAQALLETGYFTSNVCLDYNNLFGLRRPSDGTYYRFESWEQSVKAYKRYIQHKYKGGDYYRFLQRIGYAEDPNYFNKVRSISNAL